MTRAERLRINVLREAVMAKKEQGLDATRTEERLAALIAAQPNYQEQDETEDENWLAIKQAIKEAIDVVE